MHIYCSVDVVGSTQTFNSIERQEVLFVSTVIERAAGGFRVLSMETCSRSHCQIYLHLMSWGLEVQPGPAWRCKSSCEKEFTRFQHKPNEARVDGSTGVSIRNLVVLHSTSGGLWRIDSEIEPHLLRWKETRGLNGLILLYIIHVSENPAVTHPREGDLGTGCAALVSLRDEVGHVQDDTGQRRTTQRRQTRTRL